MMIVILIVLTIFVFWSFIVLKKSVLSLIFGTFGIVLLICAVVLTTLNFNQHLGMKPVTTVTTKKIYSAGSETLPTKIILTEPIGNNSNNYVLIYRDNKDETFPTAHFKPNKKKINSFIHSTAKYQVKDVNQATVTIKETRWRWDSNIAKLLFDFAKMDGSLKKKESIVVIPKNGWKAMTPEEAKKEANEIMIMKKRQEIASRYHSLN